MPKPSPSFTFTTINGPDTTSAVATKAINNRGEIAGDYYDSSGGHGFVYDNGTFTAAEKQCIEHRERRL